MKKRLISMVLVIVLALSLCVPAMAATTENVAITYRAIKINLNGKEITPCDATGNTVEPFIMNSNGTTYLPLRAIGQALGLNVKWDGAANTVTLTSGGEVKTGAGAAGTTTGSKNVAITYRNIKVFLDGKQLELVNTKGEKVEPFILNSNSSVYLPLRVVGEALGLEVSWDSKTNTAILSGGENSIDLPVKSDFSAGTVWDGSKPTYSNGSWKQSYDVAAELMLEAAKYAKVSPEITFTLACHDPESSPAGEFLTAWADAVTIATEGAVDIDIGFYGMYSGTMAVVDDMVSGIIDFGYTLPCYFRGYFPLTNVIQNPALGIDSAEMGSNVMWELYKNNAAIQAEYDEGEVLFLWTGSTSPLAYKGNGQISRLSEVLGNGNMRANNGPAQMFVSEIGGTILGCPIGDVYNNISTGIFSAVIMDWRSIKSFALCDPGVLNYYVDTNVSSDAMALMCNKDVWEIIEYLGYDDEIKAVSGDYLLNLVGIWDYWEAAGRYTAIKNGGTIFAPSAYLRAELEIAYENVAETWVDSNGYFASQVYAQAKELAAKYK